jgi:hypothetical protein
MKRSILLILACILFFPFIARSQNEGIKPVANPVPVKQNPTPESNAPLAVFQEQQGEGGGPSGPGIKAVNSILFLEPGWIKGSVMLNDMTRFDDLLLRYDIYHQQIQFIRRHDTLAFSKPEEVKYFMLGDKKFVYSDFENDETSGKSYFEVVSEGGCKLLLHRTIKYHPDEESGDNVKKDDYVRECQYYLEKKGDDPAKPVRACRKGVLCAFKDKEDQVKAYLDENDLKLNTCDEMKQVVDFYNSLQ